MELEIKRTSGEGGLILVAEDDRALSEYLTLMLTESGYEVETALDGQTAVAALRARRPDVVLTDIGLPGVGGLEVLRIAHEGSEQIPVVVMTGEPDTQTVLEAIDLGALHYLRKPTAPAEILRAVEDAVRRGRVGKRRGGPTGAGVPGEDLDDQEQPFAQALGSIWLAYQPVISARAGTVFGHETLLRTRERSFSSPRELLETARRLGRLHDLGRQVRRQLVAFLDLAMAPEHELFFLNLDSRDFLDEQLFAPGAALSGWARRMVLDLPGRDGLADIADLRARIDELRALGFRFALDDVGGGYASLSLLAALEPEFIKIDYTLVRGIASSPVQQSLVRSLVSLSAELGTQMIAEQVETLGERDVLVDLGVDLLQGFLFKRPSARLLTRLPGQPAGA